MPLYLDQSILMVLALIGLYSPVAAVSSYIPVLQPFSPGQQLRISLGLFLNVAGIALVTILIGEPLLVLLGITTAALSATGGIALILAAVPLMRGTGEADQEEHAAGTPDHRSVVFMPMTFPLTIGGATVAILVGFRAEARGVAQVTGLAIGVVAYAIVTGLCAYIAGHVQRRISGRARQVLDRVAGIILVAIAATLLASGFTRLVVDVLHNVKIL